MKKLILGVLACVGAMSSCAMVKPLEGTWLKPGEKLVCFGDSITANEGKEGSSPTRRAVCGKPARTVR